MSEPTDRTDGDLLDAFAAEGRQEAFAELVARHGAMVRGVCARILGDPAEAEDVAQATFLVLAQKARRLRKDPSVGGWLHEVARRLARKTVRARMRRARREETAMSDPSLMPTPAPPARFREELDDALGALPERYRAPLILFHLEGLSLREVARRLGRQEGTVGTQVARGREMLRRRLARQGVAIGSAAVLTEALTAEAVAAVPAAFIAQTAAAATWTAGTGLAAAAAGGAVSANVLSLTLGASTMLTLGTLKSAGLTAAAGLALAGGGLLAAQSLPSAPPPEPVARAVVESAAEPTVVLGDESHRETLTRVLPLAGMRLAGTDRAWRTLVSSHPAARPVDPLPDPFRHEPVAAREIVEALAGAGGLEAVWLGPRHAALHHPHPQAEIAALADALRDPDAQARRIAAWRARFVEDARVPSLLADVLLGPDPDEDVRFYAERSLHELRLAGPDWQPLRLGWGLALLQRDDLWDRMPDLLRSNPHLGTSERYNLVSGMVWADPRRALDTLTEVGGPEAAHSADAARALLATGDPAVLPRIREILERTGDRAAVLRALPDLPLPETMRLLEDLFDPADRETALPIIQSLGRIGGPEAWERILRLMERAETMPDVAGEPLASRLLRFGVSARADNRPLVAWLTPRLNQPGRPTRESEADLTLLGASHDPTALEPLRPWLAHADPALRRAAQVAAARARGGVFGQRPWLLVSVFDDLDPANPEDFLTGLDRLHSPEGRRRLVAALRETPDSLRRAAERIAARGEDPSVRGTHDQAVRMLIFGAQAEIRNLLRQAVLHVPPDEIRSLLDDLSQPAPSSPAAPGDPNALHPVTTQAVWNHLAWGPLLEHADPDLLAHILDRVREVPLAIQDPRLAMRRPEAIPFIEQAALGADRILQFRAFAVLNGLQSPCAGDLVARAWAAEPFHPENAGAMLMPLSNGSPSQRKLFGEMLEQAVARALAEEDERRRMFWVSHTQIWSRARPDLMARWMEAETAPRLQVSMARSLFRTEAADKAVEGLAALSRHDDVSVRRAVLSALSFSLRAPTPPPDDPTATTVRELLRDWAEREPDPELRREVRQVVRGEPLRPRPADPPPEPPLPEGDPTPPWERTP